MIRRLAVIAVVSVSLGACSDWWGAKEPPPLPGKRISILSRDKILEPEASGEAAEILLPPPEPNDEWPQVGGASNHAMHHMEVNETLRRAWSTDIGSGSGKRAKLLAQPIIAEGKVFTLDADTEVTAVDEKTGRRIWSRDITPKGEDDTISGGGLAYEDGYIFAATGFAQVVALEAQTGKVVWRQTVSGPLRGAPTVRAGRVFVITVDNQTHALAAEDGSPLWTHSGIAEPAALLGGNSPAVEGDVVVVPYSSGELFALRLENGAMLWQDALTTVRRTEGLSQLTDIRGRPVIDRGRVYAVGHANLMAAIDLRSGRRLWDKEIGGIQSPWIVGDYLYAITNDSEVVALEAKTGRVRWVTQLQRWVDEESRDKRIVWAGPVVASDRLVIGGSHGKLVALSPYTGELLGVEKISDGVSIPPAVANGSIYFLTDDADLVCYR